MPNKKNEEIEYETNDADVFDDDDIGWDDDAEFDWNDNGDNPNKDDRKPIEALRDGVKDGVKNAFTLNEVKDNVMMVLPRDVKLAKDEFSDYVSRGKNIMDEAVTSVRSDVNRIRNSIAKAIPLAERSIPSKRIVDILKRLGKTEEIERQESEKQREESEIAEKLKDFTQFQVESQKQQFAADLIRTETERKRFESQQDLLYAIEDGIKRGTSFHEQLTPKFYFKNLETGYRQLIVQTKIQNTLAEAMSHQRTALDTIVKNTALPDIVKQHKTELFKDLGLRTLYSAATNRLSDYTSSFKDKFFQNFSDSVKGFTDTIRGSTDMATSMGDMAIQGAEMEAEFGESKNKAHTAGEMVAKHLTSFLARQGMRWGINKYDKNDKVGGLATYIGRIAKSLPERANKFASKSNYDDGLLINYLKSLIPRSEDTEVSHNLSSIDQLNKPVQYDGLARRSIVDIIPQLLSQIHLSTEGIRKGLNPDQVLNQGDLLEYDHHTLELTKREDIDKALLNKIQGQMSPDTLKRQAMQIVNAIDPWDDVYGFALDKEQRLLLAKEIGLSLGKHKGFDPADMVNENYRWHIEIPQEDKVAIVNHIRSSFRVGEDTRFDAGIQKRLQRIDMVYRDMENTRGGIQKTIAQYSSINDTTLKSMTRIGMGQFSGGTFVTNSKQQYNPMLFHGMGDEYTINKMKEQYHYDNDIDITMEDFRQMKGYKVVKLNEWMEEAVIENNEDRRNPVFAKGKNGARKKYVTFDEVKDAMARNEKYRNKMNHIIRNIREGREDTALKAYNAIKSRVTKYRDKMLETKQGKYLKGRYDDAKGVVGSKFDAVSDAVKNTAAYKETTRIVDETILSFSNHTVTQALSDILHDDELNYTDKIKAVGELSVATAELAKDGIMTTVESEEFQDKLNKVKDALQNVAKVTGENAQSLYIKHTTDEQRGIISDGVSKAREALEQIKEDTTNRLTNMANLTKEKLLEQEFIADLNEIVKNEDLTTSEKVELMSALAKETGDEVAKVIPEKGKMLKAVFNDLSKKFVNDLKDRSKDRLNVKSIRHADDSKFSISTGPRPRQTRKQQAVNVLNSFKRDLMGESDDPDPDGRSIQQFIRSVNDSETIQNILAKANKINADGIDANEIKDKVINYKNIIASGSSSLVHKLYGAGVSGVDEIINKAKDITGEENDGSRFDFIKKFKEFTQRNIDTSEQIFDIYVKGDQEPRLMASKLRKGHYVLREDQKVVRKVEDITDTVIDITTGEVVITQDDINKGLIDYSGNEGGVTKLSESKFMKRLDKIQKLTGDPIKAIAWVWNKTFAKTMDTTDIYLKSDLETPIMSRWGMMFGKYFTKDKKPIKKVKDINGPVYDSFGNVLIDENQLADGLVDKKGRPLRGYLIRRGRVAFDALKGMAKAAWWASKPARWLTKKAIGTGLSALGGGLSTMFVDPTVNRMGSMVNRGIETIGDKASDVLDLFKRTKKVRTIDGITVDAKTGKERKGNYRDEMKAQDDATRSRADQAKARLEQMRKEREAREGKGTGIFGLLGKYFPLILGAFTGLTALFSGFGSTLSTIAGSIGTLINLIPGVGVTRLAMKGMDFIKDLMSDNKGVPDVDIDTVDKNGKKTKSSKVPSNSKPRGKWGRFTDWAKNKVNIVSPSSIGSGVKGETFADKYSKVKEATKRVGGKAINQGLSTNATRTVVKQAGKEAMKTTTTQAAKMGGKAVLKTVGKRALMFLGPIGAAISAAWLLYDVGSWIYSVVTAPDTIDKYRIAAYGINPENEEQAKTILKLEEYMAENARVTAEGVVTLPELKGDELAKFIHTCLGGQEGLERFNALPQDEQQAWQEGFQEWFNYRFCGVLQRNISVLKSIDPEVEYINAFGKYTGDLKNGLVNTWALRSYYKTDDAENPYNILFDPFSQLIADEDNPIASNKMDQSAVKSYLDKVLDEYRGHEKALRMRDEVYARDAKAKGKEYKSLFGDKNAVSTRENNTIKDGTISSGLDQANKTRAVNRDGSSATLSLEGNNAYIRSDASKIKLDGRSIIDDLIAIRMRLYGLTDLVDTRVKSLLEIEATVAKYIRIDGTGAASIDNIDITKLIAVYAPALNWNISEDADISAFRSWFQYRFAPVYLAYISELYHITQSKDFESAINRLTVNDKHNIALVLIGLQVPVGNTEIQIWDIDFSPVKGLLPNKDRGSITRNLESLQAGIEEKILTESDPRGIKEAKKGSEKDADRVGYSLANEVGGVYQFKDKTNPVNIALMAAQNALGGGKIVDGSYSQGQGTLNANSTVAADGSGSTYNSNAVGKVTPDKKSIAKTMFEEMNKLGWSQTEQNLFLSQVDIETGGLKYLRELGPDSRFLNYKGGPAFKGRGIIQLTHQDNYQAFARAYNRPDIMSNPDLVATDPYLAVHSGIYWWENAKRQSKAFRDAIANGDVVGVSKGVNRGPGNVNSTASANHQSDRVAAYKAYNSGTGRINKIAGVEGTAVSTDTAGTTNTNSYSSTTEKTPTTIDTSGLNPLLQKAFFNQDTGVKTLSGKANGSGFGERNSLYDGVETNKMPVDSSGINNMYSGTGGTVYHEYDWGKSDPSKKSGWQNIKPTSTSGSELTKNEVQRSANPEYGPVFQHMGSENDKAATGLEGLLMQATPELVELGKKSLKLNYSSDLGKLPNPNEMNPAFMKLFYAMLGDYKKQKGGKGLFGTNQMHRNYQDQVIMKNKYGKGAATPGNSKHGWGAAIDLNQDRASTEDLFSSGIAQKWGFVQSLKDWKVKPEWWHIENKYIGIPKGKKNGDYMGDVSINGLQPNNTSNKSADTVDTVDNGALSQTVNNTPMQYKPESATISKPSLATPSFAPTSMNDIQPTVQKTFYGTTTDSQTGTANEITAQTSTNMGIPNIPTPHADNQTKLIEAQQQRVIESHQKMVESVSSILTEQLSVQKETRDIMSQLVALFSNNKDVKKQTTPNTPPKPTMNTSRMQTASTVPRGTLNVSVS